MALVLMIVVLGACMAPRTPLPTYQVNPAASSGGVLIEGRLELAPARPCVLIRPAGYPPIALEWPTGYTVAFDPLRIYDPAGKQIATEGVDVSFGGDLLRVPNIGCGTDSTFRVTGLGQANDAS
jgi:hypothetical protein